MKCIFRIVKRRLPFLWFFVEIINGFFLRIFFYNSIMKMNLIISIDRFENNVEFENRKLILQDFDILYAFLSNLDENDTKYFKPFSFSKTSIKHILKNSGYISYGLFVNGEIKAFFFLRLYVNRKAFLGFLVDKELRRKGLGNHIIKLFIMACSTGNFSLYSTVSNKNIPSWKSHINNGFKIITQIDNHNYLLRVN